MDLPINVTDWPGLQTVASDASVIGADGREYPLNAMTPVSSITSGGSNSSSGSNAASDNGTASGPTRAIVDAVLDKVLPPHFGVRLAVGIVAVLLALIALWRILAPAAIAA